MTVEVCLGVERVAQPVPARNEGGDCFACATTAALRFLYPERSVALDEVWDLFAEEYYDGSAQRNLQKLRDAVSQTIERYSGPACKAVEGYKSGAPFDPLFGLRQVYEEVSAEKPKTTVSNTWHGMEKVLNKASFEWGHLEIEWDMVTPRFERERSSYPWAFQVNGDAYTKRLEGWLRGGWVALTEIDADGKGPTVLDGDKLYHNSINHFILLDGVRHQYVEHRDENGKLQSGGWDSYIHVVDSSTRDITGWHEARTFLFRHAATSWWLARRDQR